MGNFFPNQWFQYYDQGLGQGYCQCDGFWLFPTKIVLVEVKLTGSPHGKFQMEWLYKPILEFIYNRPVVCLLVCKWVGEGTPGPFVKSPEEFLAAGHSFATLQLVGE